jgi:hypothetical protein
MSINIEVSQNSEPPSPRIIHSNQSSTPSSPTLLPLSPAFQPVKENVLTTSQNMDLIIDKKKPSRMFTELMKYINL